jgi:hypothetical protein
MFNISVAISGKGPLERSRRSWQVNIETILIGIGREDVAALLTVVMNLRVPQKDGNFGVILISKLVSSALSVSDRKNNPICKWPEVQSDL